MRAWEFSWVKATMRAKAASCASFHKPVHPCVMRASGATHVISVKMRSFAEYMHIGETTTRFSSVISRKRKGWKRGGKGRSTSTSWP